MESDVTGRVWQTSGMEGSTRVSNETMEMEDPECSYGGKTDLLLRFFNSGFFNEWIAVTYLWKTQSEGVEDYLCNRIYTLPEDGVERYLNQLCTIVTRKGSERLKRVLVDLCGCSLRFACKVHWLLLSIAEDRPNSPFIQQLQKECERAAVQGKWHLPFRKHVEARTGMDSKEEQVGTKGRRGRDEGRRRLEIRRSVGQTLCISCGVSSEEEDEGEGFLSSPPKTKSPKAVPPSVSTFGSLSPQGTLQKLRNRITRQTQGSPRREEPTSPRIRRSMFAASLDMVKALCEASVGLAHIYSLEARKETLVRTLKAIDKELDSSPSVIFPMTRGKRHDRIVRIPPEEALLLNSRDKAPFLLCLEVLKEDHENSQFVQGSNSSIEGIAMDSPASAPFEKNISNGDEIGEHFQGMDPGIYDTMDSIKNVGRLVHVALVVEITRSGSLLNLAILNGNSNSHSARVRVSIKVINSRLNVSRPVGYIKERVPSFDALRFMAESQNIPFPHAELELPGALDELEIQKEDVSDKVSLCRKARETYGELFSEKKARVRKQSAYGLDPNWDLYQLIVKSGDDCRQELLAFQLVQQFYDIFKESGLSLWVYPYEVLVTSSHAAFIEIVPDAISIHSLKSRWSGGLHSFFMAKYGDGTQTLKDAKRRFVESMAGYSLVCYLLQVKDRHNGNILLDNDGHLIHVDYGFMLSNSPGGVNFETAPFKLTREFLEVMDSDAEGSSSDLFDYFKVLLIQGFLACRKHSDRILLLVEMMQHSGSPCFKSGAKAIQNLSKRLHLSLTEEQCVELVLGLVRDSLDAWRTRQYDYYQRVLNGIQ